MRPSLYIQAMHPKTEIKPDAAAIKRILAQGWWAQKKIHGHRAQIHFGPPDLREDVIAYTRKGDLHKKLLPAPLIAELYRLFQPKAGWLALDCEWVKGQDKLYLFDVLKWEGEVLRHKTYEERYELLPQVYKSPSIETLPVYKTLVRCLEVLGHPEEGLEGLVFKAPHRQGFHDTSVIRCRSGVHL